MADLRIPYTVADNYLGQRIAQMVAEFNTAYNSTLQIIRILGCIGTDEDIENALGMPHALDYAYHLNGLLATQKTAMDSLASDIVKIDKGL